jgi:hypothetical protein
MTVEPNTSISQDSRTAIFLSAIAPLIADFASSSEMPAATTRASASASDPQSGVYATGHRIHRPLKRLARSEPDGGGDGVRQRLADRLRA